MGKTEFSSVAKNSTNCLIGKTEIFPQSEKVLPSTGCPRSGKKSGKKYFFKVRELSGNFEICQGILEFKQKSGKSQGILK